MYRSLYPGTQRASEGGNISEDAGDNSSQDSARRIQLGKNRTFKSTSFSNYASNIVQSQQGKREALRKSLIPNDDPLVFKAMMTGVYQPANAR